MTTFPATTADPPTVQIVEHKKLVSLQIIVLLL